MSRGPLWGPLFNEGRDRPGDRSPETTSNQGRDHFGDRWGPLSEDLGTVGGVYEIPPHGPIPAERYYRGDPADLIRSFLAGLTPSWHRDAACLDRGDADWFSRRAGDIEVTVAICGECPVMLTCRHEAIERGENYGVWGGLDEQALRAAVKLHRKRGDHA